MAKEFKAEIINDLKSNCQYQYGIEKENKTILLEYLLYASYSGISDVNIFQNLQQLQVKLLFKKPKETIIREQPTMNNCSLGLSNAEDYFEE